MNRDSVLVAVKNMEGGGDAVEWAAAEAAGRGCALRIVHVITRSTLAWGSLGAATADLGDAQFRAVAARTVEKATKLARAVAPELKISTEILAGSVAAAILRNGRPGDLIVLGRGGRSSRATRSISSQVAARSSCPIAVVELSGPLAPGPSAGRVVVSLDDPDGLGGVNTLLEFAFRSAARRGVGVTALHTHPRPMPVGRSDDDRRSVDCRALDDILRWWRSDIPDVDVRLRVFAAPVGPALAAESAGAALIVLGSRPHRRWLAGGPGAATSAMLSFARSPVIIVGTAARNHRDDSPKNHTERERS